MSTLILISLILLLTIISLGLIIFQSSKKSEDYMFGQHSKENKKCPDGTIPDDEFGCI